MIDKREILTDTTFGQRVAEEEIDSLSSYFVETEHWRKVFAGAAEVIYGPKGSGKSAIYFLLVANVDALFDRGILFVPAESPRGTPAFRDLVADPPNSEPEFIGMWKLYLLTLAAEQLESYGIRNGASEELTKRLRQAGLLARESNLRAKVGGALQYARRVLRPAGLEGEVKLDPVTGMPMGIAAKISFHEPSAEQRAAGVESVDNLFHLLDTSLQQSQLELWLALDRLDVAFSGSPDLEKNALRALFRVYIDLASLRQVRLKIFLRDDIWRRMTQDDGFREASHITRQVTITWDEVALLNLVVRRLLQNEVIVKGYGLDPESILSSMAEQQQLVERLFPLQVEQGKNKPTTFNWMLSRTRDGTKKSAPRELIHLLEAARSEQLRSLELGRDQPAEFQLISATALKEALPEVSRVRLEQTLYAEYPAEREWIQLLEGAKSEQTVPTLAATWGCAEAEAGSRAGRLVEIGFFEPRGSRADPSFWVPFLYRDALKLVQGSAD